MTEEEDFMERHLDSLAADLESSAAALERQKHLNRLEHLHHHLQAAARRAARKMYEYEPEVPALRIVDSIASVVYERDYRLGSDENH